MSKEINDKNVDQFIHDYINSLPKDWRSDLDMYLGMKNAMIVALSIPEKYLSGRKPCARCGMHTKNYASIGHFCIGCAE